MAPSAAPAPDDRVELVDEEDDPAFGVCDLLEHGLEPLLELAPVLGPGDERAHVEGNHPLVLERLRHVAADDPLGKSLDDRGLAHAGLADEDRVVLGAPRQDLDDAPDLLVAADHRVELARPRRPAVRSRPYFSSAWYVLSGVWRGHPLAAAHLGEGGKDRLVGWRRSR